MFALGRWVPSSKRQTSEAFVAPPCNAGQRPILRTMDPVERIAVAQQGLEQPVGGQCEGQQQQVSDLARQVAALREESRHQQERLLSEMQLLRSAVRG